MGSGARHNEKGVYLTLCLRPIESRKFVFTVLNIATVDVPGVIISIPKRLCRHGVHLAWCSRLRYTGLLRYDFSYRRGLLTLSVQLRWAMLEPRCVEWTAGKISTLSV